MTTPNQSQSDFWNGDIATRWIAQNLNQRRTFSNVANALLNAADLKPDHSVLDIGCGTGDSTYAAAKMVSGPLLGVDISVPMVQDATKKNESSGRPISFQVADAQIHPFAPASVDRIISRFGMMFFADPVAALRNIASALRPGGGLRFICWGPLQDNPWFAVPGRIAADRLWPTPPTPPYAPGPFGFSDAGYVLGLMRAAGLQYAAVEFLDLNLTPGDTIDDVVAAATLGPISGAMREKNGTQEYLNVMLAQLAVALEAYKSEKGVVIPGRFNLFSADI